MVSKQIPNRLEKDAIAEAVCELRFECDQSSQIPEVVVGQLAAQWQGYTGHRLPTADIPPALRQVDPNLKFQPSLELRLAGKSRQVKVGPHVLSYHALAPYPGWAEFQNEINTTIDNLFRAIGAVQIVRLGLRYTNLLDKKNHDIGKLTDLDFCIQVEGRPLAAPFNLNYQKSHGPMHAALIRISSPEFVIGPTQSFSALVDVDVGTPPSFSVAEPNAVKKWFDGAHRYEKQEFFSLIPSKLIDKLKAD